MRNEIRDSLRIFRSQPAFAIVVILTLAFGIGANTAIFSLIYGVLLRPFPYREPDRLVSIQSVYTKADASVRGCSLLDVEDWRKRNRTLVDLGAYSSSLDSDLRGNGPAQPIQLTQLHPQALSILGVTPILGRLFLPEEDQTGGDVHKALISYNLWQDRFAGDPRILGRAIQTNQTTLTIVGVMPPGFGFPNRTDVWTPMESYYSLLQGAGRIKQRDSRFYPVIARLKPGVTIQQAQADLDSVAAALEQEYPKENFGVRPRLIPLRDAEVGNVRPYLVSLLTAVGFVLLICCTNVANLLLARGVARQREIAVRAALGASRRRIILAHLSESVVLSLAGGLAGAGLSFLGVNALLGLIPVSLPFWMKIEVDPAVLIFTLLISIATGLLFGIIPAFAASRTDVQQVLKEGARGSSGRGSRLRGGLVAAEVALSVLLLVGAGLMMQTFLKLQQLDPGFRPDGLFVARVTKFQLGTRAERAAILAAFHERVLTQLRQIPGVSAAAATNSLPYATGITERSKADFSIKGRSEEETRQIASLARADVSPGYFEAMKIPLIRGRYFDHRDTSTSPIVVIVNERAAKKLWPDRDPIGQEILWGTRSVENPYCRVIGVVGNVRYRAGEADDGLELYFPYTQNYGVSSIYYVLRSRLSPEILAPSVREAIRGVEENAAIVWMETMDNVINDSLWQRRLWGVLFVTFALLALLLAAIGLYGVMSYMVSQRTREVGIRIALGARPRDVLSLVIKHGFVLVAVGLATGLAGALALSQIIRSLLFGVTTTDPFTFITASMALILVAFVACYIPGHRASRIDPIVALRTE